MTDDDKQKIAQLELVNGKLEDSLERCRKLLNDYRSKLADKADEGAVDWKLGADRSK